MSAALRDPGARPRRFRVRRGLDLPVPGAPATDAVHEGPPIRSVALLGDDAPGVRAELRVEPGERVRAGQTLFVDRLRPEICFVAPGAGVVAAVERGRRRRLEALIVHLEGDEEERFEVPGAGAGPPPAEAVRRLLLASGLWTALRTRPFARIPDPDASPRRLFVTALESEPLAPPAEALVRERGEDFARGVAALASLAAEGVVVCARPGAALPLPDTPGVLLAEFEGPHPAGLPGTHIHRVAPASVDAPVWHLGWPEVLDLGRLLASGRPPRERVIALAGPAVRSPRLLRTRLGASTEELAADALRGGPCRVLSGSVLSGRQASGHAAFLGRRHTQVCALPEPAGPRRRGWLAPGWRGRAWRVPGTGPAGVDDTSLGGRPGVFFPLERQERIWPFDLPCAPLLRALVVGDAPAAREMGAVELAEEDLALATFLSPGKIEYGALLRGVLDEIEKEGP